jgi:cobalt-zinc-cadmium efflux system protein
MERSTIRSRRLAVVLSLNVAVVVAQVVGGLVSHSTGLLADAGHNLTDAVGMAVSLVAVRVALRPRDPSRTFGYHRSTILAALTNAATIAAVTVVIVVGAVDRLVHPHSVHGGVMVAVGAGTFVVNAIGALLLRERSPELNMRASAFHMASDALASAAVVLAGVLVLSDSGLHWADPVSSLAVAAVILVGAYRLLSSSVDVLLESAPADLDLGTLRTAMSGVPGVAEVHDLHVWSLSSEVRTLSAHVVLNGHPTLEEAQVIGENVKSGLVLPYGIFHATLELECERCTEEETDPCLMDSLPRRNTTTPR